MTHSRTYALINTENLYVLVLKHGFRVKNYSKDFKTGMGVVVNNGVFEDDIVVMEYPDEKS